MTTAQPLMSARTSPSICSSCWEMIVILSPRMVRSVPITEAVIFAAGTEGERGWGTRAACSSAARCA
jgi:hypothetical protein